ncbi:hybrid sensor histidine kinase/response regulator, partial [Vibrio splendidus]
MNKIRLIFLLFFSLFLALVSLIILTYSEHGKVSEYGESVRELGHEVLEMRDQITNAALADISNPYQISADLVRLEIELQELKDSYKGESIHSTFFQDLQTTQLLERFHKASIANVDTLDKLVGLSVARQFILQSLTLQLIDSHSANHREAARGHDSDKLNVLSTPELNIQSELLASVLFSGSQIQHQEIRSELADLSETFAELNQQQKVLLSQVLSVHNMEYLEQIEHQFTDLQDQLEGVIVKLIITLALLTFAFSFAIFIFR